ISLIFAPVTVAAFMYIPQELRGAAVGLFALLRNEGGSVGTSMAKTMVERRDQFHTWRLGEFLDPLNPALASFSEETTRAFLQQTGDPAAARLMTWQVLADLRHQQAISLSYFDDFWIFAAISAGLLLLVPLMRRSVAEKGAHIAAE